MRHIACSSRAFACERRFLKRIFQSVLVSFVPTTGIVLRRWLLLVEIFLMIDSLASINWHARGGNARDLLSSVEQINDGL
jgi:hypothetical protein